MNPKYPTLPNPRRPVSSYVTAGSLPTWEQVPRHCQQELVLALTALLLRQPELHPLLAMEMQGRRYEPQQ